MMFIYVLSIVISLTHCQISYRKDGDFIIGAVLPLSQSEQGKCTDKVNAKGIAICEGIMNALSRVQADKDFATLLGTTSIGYDIRDSCGNADMEKKQLYDINMEKVNYAKDKSLKKPVDIVISAFTKASLSSLDLLNIESIPQMSYDAENARLTRDDTVRKNSVKALISLYPEIKMKTHAFADLVKEFGFQYVHSIYSNDYQSREAVEEMNKQIDHGKICIGENIAINTKDEIPSALKALTKNELVKAVVVQCSKDIEMEIYKQAANHNITSFIFLSAGELLEDHEKLKSYASVIEGMSFVINDEQNFNFKTYLEKISPPYEDWIDKLFKSLGSNQDELQVQLSKNALVANYAFNGIYALANALNVRKKDQMLLDAFKNLQFTNPLTAEQIFFTDHLTTTRNKYSIYNVHGNTKADMDAVKLGDWYENAKPNHLRIQKSLLRFKNKSVEKPLSVCSEPCMMGFQRKYIDEEQCCWTCEQCPEGKASNVTNAEICISCGEGKVANPKQTKCVKYKLETFKWFEGSGVFLIFILVIGVCCALFGMGILSQNRDHDVVKATGYNTLMFYSLGCLALFLSPIPLLITPTVTSCSSYIAVFNLGLSIAFGVFFARSQFINSHFDDDGKLTKTSCSSFPRALVIFIIVGIQVLIMAVGLSVDPPLTLHSDTEQWNVRYFECSSWASYVFWIGFGYNIALSILCNFFSCTSTKMSDNCEELKYSLITICVFYMLGLAEIILFYRVVNSALAGGQGILCVFFGLTFFFCFMWPKIYIILFRSKADGKSVKDPLLLHEEEANVTTAIHAKSGFKGFGVVQMKIKEEDA